MKRVPWVCIVTGALALQTPAWAAGGGVAPPGTSSLALPSLLATGDFAASATPSSESGGFEAVRWHGLRWRDRDHGSYHDPDRDNGEYVHNSGPTGFSQLHGGFFDPDGDASNGFLVGGRGGLGMDEHLQLGLGVDWTHRSDRQSTLVSEVKTQDGTTIERRVELAHWTSDLVPMMAYAQFAPGSPRSLMPYFGIGGGYEVLFRNAEDFQTGEKSNATYSGWGWQAWAGVSLPLTNNARLNGEVFRNQSTVARDLDDTANGFTREMVPVDGMGLRVGLAWGL
jgi:hypothetical protein